MNATLCNASQEQVDKLAWLLYPNLSTGNRNCIFGGFLRVFFCFKIEWMKVLEDDFTFDCMKNSSNHVFSFNL